MTCRVVARSSTTQERTEGHSATSRGEPGSATQARDSRETRRAHVLYSNKPERSWSSANRSHRIWIRSSERCRIEPRFTARPASGRLRYCGEDRVRLWPAPCVTPLDRRSPPSACTLPRVESLESYEPRSSRDGLRIGGCGRFALALAAGLELGDHVAELVGVVRLSLERQLIVQT